MSPSYASNDPKGFGGDPKRGAALGRPTIREEGLSYEGRITLRRVRLDSGGYDTNGTYFGHGTPLYWYANEEGTIDAMLRAADRDEARRQVLALFPCAKVRK